MKKNLIIVCYLLFIPFFTFSQAEPKGDPTINQTVSDARSFRGISLGMSYKESLPIVKKDPLMLVDPNTDFEDFDEENPNWIIAKLPPLMRRVYYHFYQDKLYVISIFFNQERTSFPELYRILKKRYGKPEKLLAREAMWQVDENTTIVLDALPSLRYIDTPTLKSMAPLKTPLDHLIANEHALEKEILDAL